MVAVRVQGWDPVLIISQIISLQACHYLTLSLIVPPLLSAFTSPDLLEYSGGARAVGHIMDWREMAARPAVPMGSTWERIRGAWAGGKKVGSHSGSGAGTEAWDYGVDDQRGWILGCAWIIATAVDIAPLYYLVRRPTHILDFSLTLLFFHIIGTTYYAKAFPTSFYVWVVMALGAILMITVGEQLCIKREVSSDLEVITDDIELNDR